MTPEPWATVIVIGLHAVEIAACVMIGVRLKGWAVSRQMRRADRALLTGLSEPGPARRNLP